MSLLLLSSSDEGAPSISVDDLVLLRVEVSVCFVIGGRMTNTHTMRQGDRLPTIQALAFDERTRVDLTQFTSITFRMVSGETEIEGTATGDVNGNLSYDWADGDTAELGTYAVVFIGVDVDGRVQTLPTKTNLQVEIIARP